MIYSGTVPKYKLYTTKKSKEQYVLDLKFSPLLLAWFPLLPSVLSKQASSRLQPPSPLPVMCPQIVSAWSVRSIGLDWIA